MALNLRLTRERTQTVENLTHAPGRLVSRAYNTSTIAANSSFGRLYRPGVVSESLLGKNDRLFRSISVYHTRWFSDELAYYSSCPVLCKLCLIQ